MRVLPHAFTLRQLQYVVAVAELGSFRHAATRCRVAQPSLSAQVAQVEDALGLQIFHRESRRVTPTLAGQSIVASARHLLTIADELGDEAKRLADPSTATLRLGIIPTIAPYLLPEIAAALRQHFEAMTFVWSEDKTAVLMRKLSEATLDGAVVALEADLGEVEHVRIGRDEFVLACASRHALGQSHAPIDPAQLDGQEVLLLDDGHCLREQALSFCTHTGVQELALRATSLSTLVQMAASGMGVTLLPTLAAALENRRDDLVLRRFTGEAPYRTLALVWRKHAPLQSVLGDVGNVMRQTYAQWLDSAVPAKLDAKPRRSPREPRVRS